MNPQVTKWRVAHPEIDLPESGLETMAPFPSLSANDFIAYLSSRGEADEVIAFVRDLSRELVWAYDLVAKEQRDKAPSRLLDDVLNNCSYGQEWAFTAKFLRDYAKANNIRLSGDVSDQPAWQTAINA